MNVEQLEHRLAPVVGAFADAAVVARGTGFDGVVNLNNNCTGSLLFTGRHILTAAHCVDADGTSGTHGADGPVTVTYELRRGPANRDVTLTVPAGHIRVHPNWNGTGTFEGNDIAILKLTDQDVVAVNRHLVPPFSAQRYSLYNFPGDPELGQTFTIVGYGLTGTGATGRRKDTFGTKRMGFNRWDMKANRLANEVQIVFITGNPTGGTFTLTFYGQTTQAIPHNASAAQVQAALVALPNIDPGDVGVGGGNGPNLPWYVEFKGALASTPLDEMTADGRGLTGGINPQVAVAQRIGGRRYQLAENDALAHDFDNNTNAATDALGKFYGLNDVGLGNSEAFVASGDSGGPAFLNGLIAGVTSFGIGFGGTPDARPGSNSSFGEIGVHTRIKTFAPWINGELAGGFHLVLDMNQQVLGTDGVVENLVINVSKIGPDLRLEVINNSSGLLSGIYYTIPHALVSSLTIRGSDDNETVRILNDLELTSITTDGRGGNDRLEWGVPGISPLPDDGLRFLGGNGDDTFAVAAGTFRSSQIMAEAVEAVQVIATLDVNRSWSVERILLTGTLTGSEILLLTGLGSSWTQGTMSGTGITFFLPGSTFTIGGSAAKGLAQRILLNAGSLTWTSTGPVIGSQDALLLNLPDSTVDFQSDNDFLAGAGGATLMNLGTLRKSAGVLFTDITAVFITAGTVEVQTGYLLIAGGGASSSSWAVSAGATIRFNSSAYNLDSGTAITGAGLVHVYGTVNIDAGQTASVTHVRVFNEGGGAVVNLNGTLNTQTFLLDNSLLQGTGTLSGTVTSTQGRIQPGGAGATGRLTINGNYTHNQNALLLIELAAGSYDQLVVTGNLTINSYPISSNLGVIRLNDYTPPIGAEFEIVSYGSRAGEFVLSGLQIPNAAPPRRLDPSYGPASLRLRTVAA